MVAGMQAFSPGEPPSSCAAVTAETAQKDATVCTEFGMKTAKYLSCEPKSGKRYLAYATLEGCEAGRFLEQHGFDPGAETLPLRKVESFPEPMFVFTEPSDNCGPFSKCKPLDKALRKKLGKEPLPCLETEGLIVCRGRKGTTYRLMPNRKECDEASRGRQSFCDVD